MTAHTATVVTTSWSVPPISTIRFMDRRLFSDISSPMVNIRRMTPSSASNDTCSSVTRPRPAGPTTIPVMKYPIMNGIRKRLPTKRMAMAHASTITTDMISSVSVSTCNTPVDLCIFHGLMRECTTQTTVWSFLCYVFCHYKGKYPELILSVVFFMRVMGKKMLGKVHMCGKIELFCARIFRSGRG